LRITPTFQDDEIMKAEIQGGKLVLSKLEW
jgi:hypothetical protein